MEVPKKHISRKTFFCPIFGNPKDLSTSQLPTYEEVLKCCFEERFKLASGANYNTVCFSTVAKAVAQKILVLYDVASIPTITEKTIVHKIKSYHSSYYNLRKSYSRDKEKQNYKHKLEKFKEEAAKLFDVASCKCLMILNCICGKSIRNCICKISINCCCERSKKIPLLEIKFMYDQRNGRFGRIGQVDKKESEKRIKRLLKAEQGLSRFDVALNGSSFEQTSEEVKDQSPESEEETENYNFVPSKKHKPSSGTQMRIELKSTALVSDRYGISDRATAAIALSILKDVGIINESDKSLVIDKNKVRREKERLRSSLQDSANIILRGLYFDGRKDETLVVETMHSKNFRRRVKEEHISLIQEPGSNYISHVSPRSSSARNITDSIISHPKELKISLGDLDVVGCDGTATNTGWKNGIIHNIEMILKIPLQWIICMLHFNELPFRHLFEHLDGQTAGPKSFCGPIGKCLLSCENLPVVKFESIDCDIPSIDEKDLKQFSKDQKYLLNIASAIKSGFCPPDLAVSDPGPLCHSRWLTAANRNLRLYVSTVNPSNELIQVVNFVLACYMPAWFAIKKNSSIIDGPKHVFKVIETSRYLPENLLQILDPVIQRNGFFAHPENLLLAMAMDERRNIRELGLKRITEARKSPLNKKKPVRDFFIPKINFAATDYSEIIDWSSINSSPPLLRHVSTEHITSLIESGVTPDWDIRNFPCHTQSVERCVKLVTEAAGTVVGYKNRDGFIRTTLMSREIMPSFTNKAQFNVKK